MSLELKEFLSQFSRAVVNKYLPPYFYTVAWQRDFFTKKKHPRTQREIYTQSATNYILSVIKHKFEMNTIWSVRETKIDLKCGLARVPSNYSLNKSKGDTISGLIHSWLRFNSAFRKLITYTQDPQLWCLLIDLCVSFTEVAGWCHYRRSTTGLRVKLWLRRKL